MKTQSPQEKLQMYLNARRPIIYIRNFDFQSVDNMIAEVCDKDYVIDEYSEASGRIDFRTKSPKGNERVSLAEYLGIFNSAQFNNDKHHYLIVLKEVHNSLNDPQVYSTLQTISQRVKMSDEDQTHTNKYDVTIIIVDSKLVIPYELEKLVTLVDVKLPDDEGIRKIVKEMAKINLAYIEDDFMPDLVSVCSIRP